MLAVDFHIHSAVCWSGLAISKRIIMLYVYVRMDDMSPVKSTFLYIFTALIYFCIYYDPLGKLNMFNLQTLAISCVNTNPHIYKCTFRTIHRNNFFPLSFSLIFSSMFFMLKYAKWFEFIREKDQSNFIPYILVGCVRL